MGCTACTEIQCLDKGALYFFLAVWCMQDGIHGFHPAYTRQLVIQNTVTPPDDEPGKF